MTDEIPLSLPCPCGRGYAELVEEPIVERPDGREKRLTTYKYRHSRAGCPVGGHIVKDGDRISRRSGPLFRPKKYRIPGLELPGAASSRRTAAADALEAALVTDGGFLDGEEVGGSP